MFSRSTKWPAHFTLSIDGRDVHVEVRTNQRSKSYRLSIKRGGGAVITVPPHGRVDEVERFLDKQRNWLAARMKRMPEARAFIDGAMVPIRGEEVRIVGTDRLRGVVKLIVDADEPQVLVPGGPDHLARRLTDWLKKQAHIDLSTRTAFHAERLGVQASSISLRSQSSRWGSCSSAGRLNYNWRLIMAPPFVLDYVAAHEVAHLREMNHSAAFWALVEETLPDMERGRAWLRANGGQLMAIGLEAGV